jgi:hypothetical protein
VRASANLFRNQALRASTKAQIDLPHALPPSMPTLLLFILGLALAASASSQQCAPFTCKRWVFKDHVYYLGDLDRVFSAHSSNFDARVSLCHPLALDQLSAPDGSNGNSGPHSTCPLGSHVCIWRSAATDSPASLVAAFGPASYSSVNTNGNPILYFFDGLSSERASNATTPLFPILSRLALIYKPGEREPYLYGPDVNGSCLDFRLFSDKLKPAWNGGATSDWGFFSWLFFLSFLSLTCYFVFGYIYKSSVLGLSGLDAIPHVQLWSAALDHTLDILNKILKRSDSDGRGSYEPI